jgi:hypothetical protein
MKLMNCLGLLVVGDSLRPSTGPKLYDGPVSPLDDGMARYTLPGRWALMRAVANIEPGAV